MAGHSSLRYLVFYLDNEIIQMKSQSVVIFLTLFYLLSITYFHVKRTQIKLKGKHRALVYMLYLPTPLEIYYHYYYNSIIIC